MSTLFDHHRVASLFAGRDGKIGNQFEFHEQIGSTNDRARELSSSGAPEGAVVAAVEQTQGRGRGGRTWHSPAGLGLYLSVILRPAGPPSDVPLVGLLAAVAAAKALGPFAGRNVSIKWPNDLVLEADTANGTNRRKVAGILAEGRTGSASTTDVIVGIGINVNQNSSDFPVELRQKATSLRLEAGKKLDLADVAISLLSSMDSWYTIWKTEGREAVLRQYRSDAVDLDGKRVTIRQNEDEWTGVTAGLSDSGALTIKKDSQDEIVEIRYGELTRINGES